MPEYIEGRNPVIECLKAGRRVEKIWLVRGARGPSRREIEELASKKGVPVLTVDKREIDRIAQSRAHQGVVAVVAPREYVEVQDLLQKARVRNEAPLLLMLDGIEDPRNLGAIIRTADAAGVHGVIIRKKRSVGVTTAVVKASAGAVEYVLISRVANLVQVARELKKEGLWVIGAVPDGALYWETDLTGPLVVVIGSEGKGISRLLKEECDFLVRMPMKGGAGSLNASVAAGAIVYEVLRQRYQVAGRA